MKDDILIEWDDRYSMHIRFIDDQHKELINLTNRLYKGCLGGDETACSYFMEAIRGTVDYVKYHFSTEEKMLESIHYPDLAQHKKEHESFVKRVLEDVRKFQTGKKFIPNEFVRYLKDWVLTHIAIEDKKYSEYILNLKKKGLLTTQASDT
ncbi:MAG: bacteriohemerythrin [Treponema sp.]|jgi:hemerythrin|nr:bacteriohemerythrin [Treponema sp.]